MASTAAWKNKCVSFFNRVSSYDIFQHSCWTISKQGTRQLSPYSIFVHSTICHFSLSVLFRPTLIPSSNLYLIHLAPVYVFFPLWLDVCVCVCVCSSHTPWMLSICPSFNAAPLTLHSVLTMRSALASDRNGLESRTPFLFSPAGAQNSQLCNLFCLKSTGEVIWHWSISIPTV